VVDADTQLMNLVKDGNNDEVFKRIATGLESTTAIPAG
jgi:hypothetical protein